ncbi:MAG: hypothetical protein AAF193_05020 [Bacteroidota bacterium]
MPSRKSNWKLHPKTKSIVEVIALLIVIGIGAWVSAFLGVRYNLLDDIYGLQWYCHITPMPHINGIIFFEVVMIVGFLCLSIYSEHAGLSEFAVHTFCLVLTANMFFMVYHIMNFPYLIKILDTPNGLVEKVMIHPLVVVSAISFGIIIMLNLRTKPLMKMNGTIVFMMSNIIPVIFIGMTYYNSNYSPCKQEFHSSVGEQKTTINNVLSNQSFTPSSSKITDPESAAAGGLQDLNGSDDYQMYCYYQLDDKYSVNSDDTAIKSWLESTSDSIIVNRDRLNLFNTFGGGPGGSEWNPSTVLFVGILNLQSTQNKTWKPELILNGNIKRNAFFTCDSRIVWYRIEKKEWQALLKNEEKNGRFKTIEFSTNEQKQEIQGLRFSFGE